MRHVLIVTALAFVTLFLLLPLGVVFTSALAAGFGVYAAALADSDTLSAMRLTLTTAAVAVPLNLTFGTAAAWLLAKYEFFGKSTLATLIDLPVSVSPVVAGLVFVLLFGARGWLAPVLDALDVKIIFAAPGIAVVTTFVTCPLVAREVLAVMQAQGSDEEEAALSLGANGFQILRRITFPKIKWGVLYGVVLCNARAMGEFGAVSVVSGHIRGQTNTIPLHVEVLFGDYQFVAAFAVASVLALLALATLVLKHWIVWQVQRGVEAQSKVPGLPLPIQSGAAP